MAKGPAWAAIHIKSFQNDPGFMLHRVILRPVPAVPAIFILIYPKQRYFQDASRLPPAKHCSLPTAREPLRALHLAGRALAQEARVLVFPDLSLTGSAMSPPCSLRHPAEDLPPLPISRSLPGPGEEHDCLIIGTIRCGRQNLGFCLDREGLNLRPKIHPFGEEREHFSGGDFISPADTAYGRVGLEVCYDLRFPEVARSLALQGADFLVTLPSFLLSAAASGGLWP